MNIERARSLLAEFRFHDLFVDELGWSQPTSRRTGAGEAGGAAYSRKMVAQLAGVAVFEIWTEASLPERKTQDAIERDVAREYRENLCIFLDRERNATQSFWVWAKRSHDDEGKARRVIREHSYFRGQPADLFISKLQALFFDLAEVSEASNLTVVKVAERLREALDVERVTKRFFRDYQAQHTEFLELIEGIDDERDRRWYASIVLNRLMFVWFLQKKGFLDHDPKSGHGNFDYLTERLAASRARGKDRFFGEFLSALFFDAFAKPEEDRSRDAKVLTGRIPYLNGGLFLPHRIERDDRGLVRIGKSLRIPDKGFANLFELFAGYSWSLNDTPGGQADQIDPDVLGYIFEKYVNVVSAHSQKDLGAYYTRPEITEYLAERTLDAVILDRVRALAVPELDLPAIDFVSVPEMLARMDGPLARRLLDDVLPKIKILDPAVGSGAFLVAALKVLLGVYSAIVGRAQLGTDRELKAWLAVEQTRHRNIGYAIRRRIITDNLYGVDLLEEAAEIAKLRLFLALVASAQHVDEIEPLPNIDFNIMAGNSLIGLMRVDEHEFDRREDDFFKTPYRQLLADKNRLRENYRHLASDLGPVDLSALRDSILKNDTEAVAVLNELLRDDFERLGVQFEQAKWDADKQKEGRAERRRITTADIATERPFHWGYEFDEIVQARGGFDVVLTNPPWEAFKPQAKEFFAEHSELVTKNSMTLQEFEREQTVLLKKRDVREAWLAYLSRFPHINTYFRKGRDYVHQTAFADGKKIVTDLNLYKLFIERCFHLVRPGGRCGLVVPSGIYTDLGAKGLRDLLFESTRIEGLFGFENRKRIFEGVDSRFKFVVLTFERVAPARLRAAGERNASAPPDDLLARSRPIGTEHFPAAFMRHDVAELARFPAEGSIDITVAAVRRLSPDSLAIPEFNAAIDVAMAEKAFRFPRLGEPLGDWQLRLRREFHMTDDGALYEARPGPTRFPLVEGKMIHQFTAEFAAPRFWVDEGKARAALLPSRLKATRKLFEGAKCRVELDEAAIELDYQSYRLAFRDVARNTDERTFIGAILPPNRFCPHTVSLEAVYADQIDSQGKPAYNHAGLEAHSRLYLLGVLNSFVVDYLFRQRVTAHLSFFFVENLPVPRIRREAPLFASLVSRSAKLTCVSPEFDALARSVGLKSHKDGATNEVERARLRAELDGLVAHLYGLSEEEFAHILATFPLVSDPVRVAAHNAYRDVARGLFQ